MNIDYLEVSQFVDKDKIYLDDLEHISSNKYGWDNYSMRYNNEMQIRYNEQTRQLKVSGSLPYFVDGQNFSNDINKLKGGIEIISDTIDTNLSNAEVIVFEAGITFEIPFNPNEIFNSHYEISGMKTRSFNKTGKLYQDTIRQIKFYNAGMRVKKMLNKEDRLKLAIEKGYNPEANYLRLESRYKKPSIHFKQRPILVEDIFKDTFLKTCKEDLFDTYQKIKKEGVFTPLQNKRDCTLPTIELLVLKEQGMIHGFNANELVKNKINSMPDSVLNKEDKKNRKRSYAGLNKRITKNEVSRYDLSNILKGCLKIDECFI